MKKYSYIPKGTCSRKIDFGIEENRVYNVAFTFGCNGNTKGIGALAEGMEVEKVIGALADIDCNGRGTSCPAQLALALKKAISGELEEIN